MNRIARLAQAAHVVFAACARSSKQRQQRRRRQKPLPRMILLTDLHRVPNPFDLAISLRRNDAVIVRDATTLCHNEQVLKTIAWCRGRGVQVSVADDGRSAGSPLRYGVHLRESLIAQRRSRVAGLIAGRKFVTASAHSLRALRRAESCGVDAVILSPVFSTQSRDHYGIARPLLGARRFMQLAAQSRVSVYAMGGINLSTIRQVGRAHCVAGVALVSASEANSKTSDHQRRF